jgi:hypothetical protein
MQKQALAERKPNLCLYMQARKSKMGVVFFFSLCDDGQVRATMSKARHTRKRGISMKRNQHDQQESDFPSGLSNPARRALAGAGYVRLEQLSRVSEADLLRLHGMGPKAMDQLRRALAARGLSFADQKSSQSGEG